MTKPCKTPVALKNIFKKGDKKVYKKIVTEEDIARFDSGTVHEVCSTFSLAQAMEWSSRLFVLEMKEEDEEGIGTMLEIHHRSPALVNNEVSIEAKVESIEGNELICSIVCSVEERVVAVGKTGQKVLKKEKIDRLFGSLK